MVAGAVQPPRLDLANEDLVRAHVHAEWLAATNQWLHSGPMQDVIDLSSGDALAFHASVQASLLRLPARGLVQRRSSRQS